MKLGKLVQTFENLAENETPVEAPLTSEHPDGVDLPSGLDLTETPIDEIPESALTELEVTMEEEVFKAEQISQQLSLLEDTMNVIRTTGEVTEAQQRIINIQLRGLEPYMNEQQRALMGRYTGAPYDPETAMVVTNEALSVGMSLVIAGILAVVSVLAFMMQGMNERNVKAVSEAEHKKLVDSVDNYIADLGKQFGVETGTSSDNLDPQLAARLKDRVESLTNRMFALSTSDREIELTMFDMTLGHADGFLKVANNSVTYLRNVRAASTKLADALASQKEDSVAQATNEIMEENIRFCKTMESIGVKLDSSLIRAVGGDPSKTYTIPYGRSFSNNVFEVRALGQLQLLTPEILSETNGLIISCNNLEKAGQVATDTFGQMIRKGTDLISGEISKSEREIKEAAKTMEANVGALEGSQRQVAEMFRTVAGNLKVVATILGNHARDSRITGPRVTRAFMDAGRGSLSRETGAEVTNESFGMAMGVGIAAVVALVAVFGLIMKGYSGAAEAISAGVAGKSLKETRVKAQEVKRREPKAIMRDMTEMTKEDKETLIERISRPLGNLANSHGKQPIDIMTLFKDYENESQINSLTTSARSYMKLVGDRTNDLITIFGRDDDDGLEDLIKQIEADFEADLTNLMTRHATKLSPTIASGMGGDPRHTYGIVYPSGLICVAFTVDDKFYMGNLRLSEGKDTSEVLVNVGNFNALIEHNDRNTNNGLYQQLNSNRKTALDTQRDLEDLTEQMRKGRDTFTAYNRDIGRAFGKATRLIKLYSKIFEVYSYDMTVNYPRAFDAAIRGSYRKD